MAETFQVIERGNIYFGYRPRVEDEEVEGFDELQRFYVVLSPEGKRTYRLLAIGRKRLPEVEDGGERVWGFVDRVASNPTEIRDELGRHTYRTKTRGERHMPPVRPAGEGVYALLARRNDTRLAYCLELPGRPGEVQHELNIAEEARYVIRVKNPETGGGPRTAGLSEEREARFPKHLRERFRGRRFAEVDPPAFLDHEGAELLLVGAREEIPDEAAEALRPEEETAASAEIFRDLRLKKSEQPLEPLFTGEWR